MKIIIFVIIILIIIIIKLKFENLLSIFLIVFQTIRFLKITPVTNCIQNLKLNDFFENSLIYENT